MNDESLQKGRSILRKWSLTRSSSGNYRLEGVVKNHQRLPDEMIVQTSRLLSIDFLNKTAETRNTIYNLED
jgi:hypothetical protein